ncbi:hypothetical protein NBT05_03450 [Aquimarina sp. ERC-38]|uniref:DUF6804 family protein n=1 Tax=Aquimarina sp. ERC-38 TaxID=2949996 RepID=UPI0022465265|nr:DUF6804 family protein [Aquimarina sp. ERC-38]UZO81536.1 hypothetical protein NBT05_03450 [Aquimarina sp. ERC-38]
MLSFCCALLLFIAVLPNPLKYYGWLRGIVSLGAILVMIKNFTVGYWVILFGLILILFNPVWPIHFYMKLPWVPIDIVTGILFLVEIFIKKPMREISEPVSKETIIIEEAKTYQRDRIL